jgi:hypothetical protein
VSAVSGSENQAHDFISFPIGTEARFGEGKKRHDIREADGEGPIQKAG